MLDLDKVKSEIIAALHTIYDPEIPVDIYELGLIYAVDVYESGRVEIRMTMTTPHCPEAQTLPPTVEAEALAVEGVTSVLVDVVWDPPWGPERMSEAARLTLGM
jgi:FeS assembly SUF system protein